MITIIWSSRVLSGLLRLPRKTLPRFVSGVADARAVVEDGGVDSDSPVGFTSGRGEFR